MAETLKLNGIENANNLICFDTSPIVIKYDQGDVSKKSASITINVSNFSITNQGKEVFITFNGHNIKGENELSKVTSRKFYSGTGDVGYRAISIMNALKSISDIVLNYEILYKGDGIILITAKDGGSKYNITYSETNISGTSFVNTKGSNGTTDKLASNVSTRIYVDLFYNDTVNQKKLNNSTSTGDYKFLTTLEKEYYGSNISFNLSSVLSTVCKYGKTVGWKAVMYATVDSSYTVLGTFDGNYVINGYLVNQGNTFINLSDRTKSAYPALNVNRGTENNAFINNSILYIYDKHYELSIYNISNASTIPFTIKYLEADESEITSVATSKTISTENLVTLSFDLDEAKMREAYFIDLEFSFGTLRYNVINPPYANAENNRVYWYNSYGGIQFADFTADKDEDRKTTATTYNANTLHFYEQPNMESEIVYARENNIEVTLATHLIEKDGIYQYYDLANSYKSWINVNGVDYNIIITSIKVNEPTDRTYEVEIKYKYSLLDSFA